LHLYRAFDELDFVADLFLQLGCGTALPSLVLFQWALERKSEPKQPVILTLADYNPSVLYLVTVPNLILAWAFQQRNQAPLIEEAFTADGELELTVELLEAFRKSLVANRITLSLLSGAWSPEFVDLLYSSAYPAGFPGDAATLLLASETIYSPFALESFSSTLLSILQRERRERLGGKARALVAAKRVYFGVGGSLDDFVDKMRELGTGVKTLSEETHGVHRAVVECQLS
jgi:protein-histidine N-methyltransferase